jgi:tetratricopeptide (TPR) repeat protein
VVRQVPEVARDPDVGAALDALAVGDAKRAEQACRKRLARDPESVEFLRLLARALAMQSRSGEAEAVLRRAVELQPGFAPLHEDLGGVLAMERRFDAAIASLREALRLDPRLPLAGKKLGQALAALGHAAEADAAFEAWFEQDPDRVYVAIALDHLRAGRPEEGISNLRKALRANPDNVDAMHTLAKAYRGDEQRQSDSEALLRRAIALVPAHVSAWVQLGLLLHDTDRFEEAIKAFERATELEPREYAAWSGLGAACARIGDMQRSVDAYARSLALEPDRPSMHMSYAHSLKSVGLQEEAVRAYRKAIALKPDVGEAYWSLANLKVFRFGEGEVAAMEAQLKGKNLSESAEVHFRFALGKACEDAGDFDRAWAYYQSANQLQRPHVSFDPVGFEARHEEIIEVFTREFLELHAGQGFESNAPIFIVGLPRSGSTLIEQILASHSQVEGTLELSTLADIAVSTGRYRSQGRDYPFAVRELGSRDFRAYGQQYIDSTHTFRRTDRPRFTD